MIKWGITQAVLEFMAPASTDLYKQDGTALPGLVGMRSVSLMCRGAIGEGCACREMVRTRALGCGCA